MAGSTVVLVPIRRFYVPVREWSLTWLPSPSTAPGPTRAKEPTPTRAASRAPSTVDDSASVVLSHTTQPRTEAPARTVTFRVSTASGPTRASAATRHPGPT